MSTEGSVRELAELGREPLRPNLTQRRNPLAPLGVLVVASAVASFVLDPTVAAMLYFAGVVGAWATGCRIGTLLRAHLVFGAFALGVLVVNAVSRPGETWFSVGPFTVTDEGARVGAALGLRVLLIGVLSTAFVTGTTPTRLITAPQQQLRLSPRFGFALLTAHRMLAALPEQWALLLDARRQRAPLNRRGEPRLTVRDRAGAAFGLLVISIRRGHRVADSLQARD